MRFMKGVKETVTYFKQSILNLLFTLIGSPAVVVIVIGIFQKYLDTSAVSELNPAVNLVWLKLTILSDPSYIY